MQSLSGIIGLGCSNYMVRFLLVCELIPGSVPLSPGINVTMKHSDKWTPYIPPIWLPVHLLVVKAVVWEKANSGQNDNGLRCAPQEISVSTTDIPVISILICVERWMPLTTVATQHICRREGHHTATVRSSASVNVEHNKQRLPQMLVISSLIHALLTKQKNTTAKPGAAAAMSYHDVGTELRQNGNLPVMPDTGTFGHTPEPEWNASELESTPNKHTSPY